jgi:pyruvate/2-oxoglutarate/acetoin dehydrogenase E1 component
MRNLNMCEALNEALRQQMQLDPKILIIGEDVGRFGGAFSVTRGLLEEFGEERVRDTPISEAAIIGCGIGAALMGWHPVVEMQYADFVTIGFDQLVNQAAKIHLMSGGQASVPLVVRLPVGAKEHGAQHDQSPEAWFMHTPGLKVVYPSTAYDAKGLLISAMRQQDPVVFCEHKVLYGTQSVGGRGLAAPSSSEEHSGLGNDVPEEPYSIPLGKAEIKWAGKDLTVIATGLMIHRSIQAARQLEQEGMSVQVVDPRCLVPLDKDLLLGAVRSTHRVLVVTEETRSASCAAEIAAMIAEEAFDWLDAPVVRLNTPDVPLPFSPGLQAELIPSVERITAAARKLIQKQV